MFEFTKLDEELLDRIGKSSEGRTFLHLLRRIKNNVEKVSNIKDNKNYGAEVEGRKLASKLISDLIERMDKQKTPHPEVDSLDDFD